MGKSSNKSSYLANIVAAGALGFGSLINPNIAYSQTAKSDTVPAVQPARQQAGEKKDNRIYSENLCLSATGEGIFLKNFCYNLDLIRNSRFDVNEVFGLSAKDEDLSYVVIGGREGIRQAISYLNGREHTPENRASVSYLETLLQNTPNSDRASVASLNQAVSDGIINPRDGLVSNGILKVQNGKYVLVAKSKTTGEYKANTLPIILDIKTDTNNANLAEIPVSEVERARLFVEPLQEIIRGQRAQITKEQQTQLEDPFQQIAREQSLSREMTSGLAYHLGVYGVTTLEDEKRKEISFSAGAGLNLGNDRINFAIEPELTLYFPTNPETDEQVFVTERETKLIGPGTYKDRTDYIIEKTDKKNIAKVGLRAGVGFGKNNDFGFNFNVGAIRINNTTNKRGESLVEILRNDVVIGSDTIDGGLPPVVEKNFTYDVSIGSSIWARLVNHVYAGFNFGIRGGKKTLGVGVELNGIVR